MGLFKFVFAAASVLACATASAQPAADAPPLVSLKLTTVVMALPPGMSWLAVSDNLYCNNEYISKNATGGHDPQDLPPYTQAFRIMMERGGYKIVADENLFGQDDGTSDFQVAAVITKERIEACISHGNIWWGKKERRRQG